MIPPRAGICFTPFSRGLQFAVVVVVCNAGKTLDLVPYLVWKKRFVTFQWNHLINNCHLSNPGLRVRNLQMFGRTLGNLARQSGPHTGGEKDVRERRIREKEGVKGRKLV